jgi:hypothetical protein
MHEWTGLSRGRALALVSARDPREHPVGIFQRDPMPPPHHGPGTFTWFADHSEAADFMSQVVPVLLLDPGSWPDFDDLVADTTRIVRAVADEGAPPMAAVRALGEPWGGRADFVWWGGFEEIPSGDSDFGRLIRMQYLEYVDDPEDDRAVEGEEVDDIVRFLRAYPY